MFIQLTSGESGRALLKKAEERKKNEIRPDMQVEFAKYGIKLS